jgi:hypothetical protein
MYLVQLLVPQKGSESPAASTMAVMFTIASGMLGMPAFETFGIIMIVVMIIYYAFMWAEGDKAS